MNCIGREMRSLSPAAGRAGRCTASRVAGPAAGRPHRESAPRNRFRAPGQPERPRAGPGRAAALASRDSRLNSAVCASKPDVAFGGGRASRPGASERTGGRTRERETLRGADCAATGPTRNRRMRVLVPLACANFQRASESFNNTAKRTSAPRAGPAREAEKLGARLALSENRQATTCARATTTTTERQFDWSQRASESRTETENKSATEVPFLSSSPSRPHSPTQLAASISTDPSRLSETRRHLAPIPLIY